MSVSSFVWMVHALTRHSAWSRGGVSNGIRGVLSMEGDRLVFRPEDRREGDTAILVQDTKKAYRTAGFSPVIEIQLKKRTIPKVVWFYFAEPPNLGPSGGGQAYPAYSPFGQHHRYNPSSAAHDAQIQFPLMSEIRKEEIEGWIQRIREAQARTLG